MLLLKLIVRQNSFNISCGLESLWAMNTVNSEEGYLEEIVDVLCFSSEVMKIKEGTIQMVTDVHSFLQFMKCLRQHSCQKDVEVVWG